jgi:hypothetical protein
MFAKTIVIWALLISLGFMPQARPGTLPARMRSGGVCAGRPCVRPCCVEMECCRAMQQQKAPSTATLAQQPPNIGLAPAVRLLRDFLVSPVTREPSRVRLDDACTAHVVPPLAAGCIWLI